MPSTSPAAENAVDATVDLARTAAAAAGTTSAWFGQRFDHDAIGLAATVGREVPSLRIGTSAAPVFGRHPLLVVSQAQTAQAATHGRFQLGLVLGAPAFVEGACANSRLSPARSSRPVQPISRVT